MCNLLESTETALESLETVREAIIAIEATSSNRKLLDASYAAVVEAQRQLSRLTRPEASAE